MAAEDVLINSAETVNDLAVKLGSLGRWMQALGLVVVLWIIVQIINFYVVGKRMKKLSNIEEKLDKIDKKLRTSRANKLSR